MSDFGDFDNDDAFDTEPPDSEQVAIRLHKYQKDNDPSLPRWEDLPDNQKLLAIMIIAKLIAWLRRQGALK